MLSYEEITKISRPIVLRFLHQAKHLGSRQDAYAELMNIAYVVAREHPDSSKLRTWLIWTLAEYVKAPSEILTDRRRIYFTGEPDPAWEIERRELQEKMKLAIEQLCHDSKTILDLYYSQGYTYPEIGRQYGLSREWARKTVGKILDELRDMIDR